MTDVIGVMLHARWWAHSWRLEVNCPSKKKKIVSRDFSTSVFESLLMNENFVRHLYLEVWVLFWKISKSNVRQNSHSLQNVKTLRHLWNKNLRCIQVTLRLRPLVAEAVQKASSVFVKDLLTLACFSQSYWDPAELRCFCCALPIHRSALTVL